MDSLQKTIEVCLEFIGGITSILRIGFLRQEDRLRPSAGGFAPGGGQSIFPMSSHSVVNRRKTIKFIVCILSLLFFRVQNVSAFDLPAIYFSDYRLDKVQIEPGAKTTGAVTLWNYDQNPVSDLRFNYLLLQTIGGSQKIIDSRYGDAFSLGQKEIRTFNFSYWMPYKLPDAVSSDLEGGLSGAAGGFVLRVRVENSLGTILAWSDKPVKSVPTGVFFNLGYVPQIISSNPGLVVAGSKPEVHFVLTRPAGLERKDMIAQVIRFTTTGEGGRLQSETELPLALGTDEGETITYALPPFGAPGRYETTVRVVNRGSGDIFSNSLSYSWVVKNPLGDAKIFFASLDKEAYFSDGIAVLKVGFAPYYWDGKQPKKALITARIFDQAGQLAGERSQIVRPSDREASLRLPIIKEALNPRVAVQVIFDGRIADTYEFFARDKKEIEAGNQNARELPVPVLPNFWSLFFVRFSLYIFVFCGVILVLVMVYCLRALRFWLKKKKKQKERERERQKAAAKKILDGDSLGGLLDQFNEIDKQNRRFKPPK